MSINPKSEKPRQHSDEPTSENAPSLQSGPPGIAPGEFNFLRTEDMYAWLIVRPNFYNPLTDQFYSRDRYNLVWDTAAKDWVPVLRKELRNSEIEQRRPTWDPETDPALTHKYRLARRRNQNVGNVGKFTDFLHMYKEIYGLQASLYDPMPSKPDPYSPKSNSRL